MRVRPLCSFSGKPADTPAVVSAVSWLLLCEELKISCQDSLFAQHGRRLLLVLAVGYPGTRLHGKAERRDDGDKGGASNLPERSETEGGVRKNATRNDRGGVKNVRNRGATALNCDADRS